MLINKNQKIYIYLFCFFSLIVSFILGENSSGGSKLDNHITRDFIDAFSFNYQHGIKYFISTGQAQSPFFYFLVSLFQKIADINYLKYGYIIISSFIPIIFYISLKKKFQNVNKNYLFLLSLIIYLSPYFRSSSTWMTTDNLGILFFILSISKYLSLEYKKKLSDLLLCVTYLTIAVYIRQYYCVFFLFYLVRFFKILNLKKIIFISIYLILIFLPFLIYYYYFLENNIHRFLNLEVNNKIFQLNLLNNLLVFLSLYFFYTIPLYINKFNELYEYYKKNYLKYSIFFLIFIILFFISSKDVSNYGGGIFMKISSISNTYEIFFLSSLFGMFLIIPNVNFNNMIVYLCLIFAFPTVIIYQKYYDPLILLTLFTITKKDFINKFVIDEIINLKFLYLYFFIFLISSNLYYLTKL